MDVYYLAWVRSQSCPGLQFAPSLTFLISLSNLLKMQKTIKQIPLWLQGWGFGWKFGILLWILSFGDFLSLEHYIFDPSGIGFILFFMTLVLLLLRNCLILVILIFREVTLDFFPARLFLINSFPLSPHYLDASVLGFWVRLKLWNFFAEYSYTQNPSQTSCYLFPSTIPVVLRYRFWGRQVPFKAFDFARHSLGLFFSFRSFIVW